MEQSIIKYIEQAIRENWEELALTDSAGSTAKEHAAKNNVMIFFIRNSPFCFFILQARQSSARHNNSRIAALHHKPSNADRQNGR